ncbi:MAG: hypothetical protein PHY30_00565 [Candidatus Pacebacteria bacterium]|nr:hypothetical protein [Candidatus Paceibacterota bacterium]
MNEIIGHKKQKDFLKKIVLSGKIPHAFLFSGEENIGKTSLAIAFSKFLLCDNNGCNNCKICASIDKNIFPDLCIISKENNNIEIDKIRSLKDFLSLKSYNNKKKIAIIEEAHLMGIDSQNSILKILEEPGDNSVIILITSFPNMILGTIKSRVQKIEFNHIGRKEIEDYLILLGGDRKEAEEISQFSSGKIGKAITLFQNREEKDFFFGTIRDINLLIKEGVEKRFEYVKSIYEDKEKVSEILNILERFMRREMLLKLYRKEDNVFKNYTLLRIKDIIEEIQKTKYYFNNTNTNKKLLLENLIIKL